MADTPRVTVPVEPTPLSVCQAIAPYLGAIDQNDWSGLEDDDAISMPVKMRVGDLRDLKAVISAAHAPEGGAVKRACVDFQEAIDDFEADVADVMAEGSERADLWDREIMVNIDALKTVMNAALATREEAPAEAGEVDRAIKRMRGQLCGSATFTQLMFGREDVRLVLDTLSALRAKPPAREDAQPVARVSPDDMAQMTCFADNHGTVEDWHVWCRIRTALSALQAEQKGGAA